MKAVALILLAGVGSAFGQTASEPSLGEVARKEKEKRALKTQTLQRTGKTVTVKTYTQEDIRTFSVDETAPEEPASAAGTPEASAAVPDPAAEAAAQQEAERQQWRSRADQVRAELAAAEREQSAMEVLAAGQTIPPNALVIARDRVSSARQRLAQLEDDARRMGVPSSWVR